MPALDDDYDDDYRESDFDYDLPLGFAGTEFTAEVLSKPFLLIVDKVDKNGQDVRNILIKAKARDVVSGKLYTFSMTKDEAETIGPSHRVVLLATSYQGAKRSYLTFLRFYDSE